MELTQAAKDYVVDSGYDPVLRRPTAEEIPPEQGETAIAKAIISETSGPHPPGGGLQRQGADSGAGDDYAKGRISSFPRENLWAKE